MPYLRFAVRILQYDSLPPMFDGISHLSLYAHSVARAAQWYAATLGFLPRVVTARYAHLQHGPSGVTLDLRQAPRPELIGSGPVLYLVVGDLDRVRDELARKGVRMEPPNDGPPPSADRRQHARPRQLVFLDSEGNRLGLIEAPSGLAA